MKKTNHRILAIAISFVTIIASQAQAQIEIIGTKGNQLYGKSIAQFLYPWAMAFINEDQMLVTTKPGKLWLVDSTGLKREVRGVPETIFAGQGGLGDVILHPDFSENKIIYLSLVESKDKGKTRGAIVVRGKLELSENPELTEIEEVWTQIPKMKSSGHFSQKMAFGPPGSRHDGYLFITSGDRQEKTTAQRWDMALGKIIRLHQNGAIPKDNPFQDKGELAKSFWTLGHRNSLGIAFDQKGNLWASEMGPRHGDEFNLIEEGKNYGWPVVSNGNNYDGTEIPDHSTRPEFAAPKAFWIPTIAPSGLFIYSGKLFTRWKGNAFLGGLRSRAIILLEIHGNKVMEAERFNWGKRIRDVEEGPDGAIWVLEDDSKGRLIKITKQNY